MKIFAIDLSTHCGWAVLEGEIGSKPKLIRHGTLHLGKGVKDFGPYPMNYVRTARAQIAALHDVYAAQGPVDLIVIEETNGSKNRYTQKLLEFLHYRFIELFGGEAGANPYWITYLDTSSWRKACGIWLTKEQKKANAKLLKAKRAAAAAGTKLDKKALGIKGKITKKHAAVNYVNAEYGLQLKVKDNDAAEAICLGVAYCRNATPSNGA